MPAGGTNARTKSTNRTPSFRAKGFVKCLRTMQRPRDENTPQCWSCVKYHGRAVALERFSGEISARRMKCGYLQSKCSNWKIPAGSFAHAYISVQIARTSSKLLSHRIVLTRLTKAHPRTRRNSFHFHFENLYFLTTWPHIHTTYADKPNLTTRREEDRLNLCIKILCFISVRIC